MYDIIIIGAGPAGLTAALYARRAEKKVLILEKRAYGGQIINAENIENYPGIEKISGFDFATTLYNQALNLGCEIKYEEALEIVDKYEIITNKNRYKTKSIIIATGLEKRKLEIPGEDEYLGKGVSYCAICDGHFYKEKTVAVNGGGNAALEDAIYLSNICKKVYLINRSDKLRGDLKYQNEILKRSNIELILNTNITKISGNETLENIQITSNDTTRELNIDALFIAIGQTPSNELYKNIIDTNQNGYIKSIDTVHTNKEKIYVAGDVREKDIRQLTTAVADGTIAATTAIKEMES